MQARLLGVLAADSAGWVIETESVRSSTLILLTLCIAGVLGGGLYWFGAVAFALRVAGAVTRGSIRIGFRVWEQYLAWAPWRLFLAVQLSLLGVGVAVADLIPGLSLACALGPLAMGLAACLAYMFIDVERYEVARGYKALHDPLKGQRVATELAQYGHQVEVPLLASAAIGMIGGFALLNLALFSMLGPAWYKPPAADATYLDFVASALVHLLSVVDLLNVLDTHRLARIAVARPASGPASVLLAMFKSFFTLVLLQQIFASVRKGKLLAETIADFWSPHEPIHERARSALPQYGVVALVPLLLSLKAAETLTREQRDQLPRVLAMLGPVAIPGLTDHLNDSNEHIRAVAVATLGRLGATVALPVLSGMVNDPSDIVRLSLAGSLGHLAGPAAKDTPRPRRTRRSAGSWRLLRGRTGPAPVADPVSHALPLLRAILHDPAAAIRAEAVASLGRLGARAGAEAISDLTDLLADADETVRVRATEALSRVGAASATTVPALAGLLNDSSPVIRIAVARAFGVLGSTAVEVVPALVPLLQDRDEGVRTAVADALGKMGTLPEVAALTMSEGLASDDTVVRARTAKTIGEIGEAAADTAPALVEAVDDDNDRVRAKAVEALGKIGEAAAVVAVPRLVRALKDPDNWVSALAAEALGEMGSGADGAVPALVRSLRHSNSHVRANSAEALGKLGSVARDAVPALRRAAADDDGSVRLAAICALGAIGRPTPESARVVRAALADADPHARAAAAEAFGTWGEADETTRAELLGLLEDANDEVKARTARVLPRLNGDVPRFVEALSRRLADDDSDWVRVEAARALGQLGEAAIPAGGALVRAAQTGDAGLREEAMRALAVTQPPEAVEAFMSGLRDADPHVRLVASAGWRKAASVPEEAIPPLIEALHDPETQVRANAAYALSRLDPVPGDAVVLLADCVAHDDAGLRLYAAMALQAVPGREAYDALHPLLHDPNQRIRLIAARRVLAETPTDPDGIAAVVDTLANPAPAIRKGAVDLIELLRSADAATLDTLRALRTGAIDPDLAGKLDDLLGRIESTAGTVADKPTQGVAE